MKVKHLAAAAAMLCSGASFAQNNVTVYGIVDTGVEYLTNAAKNGTSSESVVRLAGGNLSGSRLGFKGTEDLGGGLQAVFQLENGFDSDTGALAQGGRLFGRHAYVGAGSKAAMFTLGRQQNSLYDVMIKYDPFSFSSRYSGLMHDSTFAGRPDNTVKYTGNFGSVTATAFYSFGRNMDGEVAGNSKVSRNFGGGAAYASGPLSFGAAYDQYQGNTIATQSQSARRAMLGASYDTGAVKIFGAYRSLKDEIVAATAKPVRSSLYWTGAKYQMSAPLALTGAVYYNDFKDTKADPLSVVLSADYSLSKRTDLYANLGYARNKSGSNLGLNGIGSAIVAGENQTGLVLGLRHRF